MADNVKQEKLLGKTVKLTGELIDAGKSERGGWNREQLSIINVSWPPEKGWKQKAIGTEISEEDYQRFLNCAQTVAKG